MPDPDPDFETLIAYVQESRRFDFRGYKRTSLRRRVEVRMAEIGCEGFAQYQSFLEVHPQEFAALLDTILINVTSFFRDPEAWEVLRTQVVPDILERHKDGETIRVWSIGCSSGEEPYSVAMLFAEVLGTRDFCDRVKVYATDLDEGALRVARQATYTPQQVESVPPGMLDRYFECVDNRFVFQRDLRKCVIFGRHNVVHDAPISRIDLLLCRNLMIYLETETQEVVLPRMHYALNEGGVLFLGKAETQLARSRLFEPVEMRHRLFRKVAPEARRLPPGGLGLPSGAPSGEPAMRLRMLEAIVDASSTTYLVLDLSGRLCLVNPAARRLLDVGAGDLGRPFHELPISYRPSDLRGPIEDAQRERRVVRLETQAYHRAPADLVSLTTEVTPLFGPDGALYATLLTFSDATRLHALQAELEATQESLETTIEELQSANEELETTNEELQSTNEELETTNEELQSTNEELETMNEELRSTNEAAELVNQELSRRSDDANVYRGYAESVLRSIDAGIIVLDEAQQVSSWNRWNENVWGLRAEEVIGRRLEDLDIGLPTPMLAEQAARTASFPDAPQEAVLDGTDRRGRALRCRVRTQPLLSSDHVSHGTVIILEDVTRQVRQETYARHLGRVLGQSLNEIYFLDAASLRFTLVNQGAEAKLGYGIDRLRQMTLADMMPGVPTEALRGLIRPLIEGERQEVVFETMIRGRDRIYPAEICLQHLPAEQPPILLALVHDISERQRLAGE